jgi:hypothetical protein
MAASQGSSEIACFDPKHWGGAPLSSHFTSTGFSGDVPLQTPPVDRVPLSWLQICCVSTQSLDANCEHGALASVQKDVPGAETQGGRLAEQFTASTLKVTNPTMYARPL